MKANELKSKIKIKDVDAISRINISFYLKHPIQFLSDLKNKSFKMKYFIRLNDINYQMESKEEQLSFYEWSKNNCLNEKLFQVDSVKI